MKLSLAYIAGYLDADGSITVSMTNSNRLSRKQRSSLTFSVTISGQNLDVLSNIMETLECGEIRAYAGGFKRSSGAYRYDIPTSHFERVLPLLIPHLQLKRTQAELVLALLETRSRGSHKITNAVMQMRQFLVTTIHRLNKRDGKDYRTKWVNSVEPSSRLVAKYGETIPSQASEGSAMDAEGTEEGVTTRRVSPNNNPAHEYPPRKGRDSLASTVM